MTVIAVVDNDREVLALMREVLDDRGWEFLPIASGVEAIAVITRRLPDLVVLDLWLEDPDTGFDILTRLRADPRTAQTPVLVWSGFAERLAEHADQLRQQGVAIIAKPFDLETLYGVIDGLLAG
jgi:CheY-like chemotaxis protein